MSLSVMQKQILELLKVEQHRVYWLESENKRLREVLKRIELQDQHHDMCQLDVRNCVVACNVRRAKSALEGEK